MTKNTYLTLGQAAKETGKSKATISKALKNGTLSYFEKTKAGYKIDPAELFRVFSKQLTNIKSEQSQTPNLNTENSALQARLEVTEKRLEDAQKTTDQLQRMLDDERQERKELTQRLLPSPKQNKGFFRLFKLN